MPSDEEVGKHLTENQMFGSSQTASQRPRDRKPSLIYISRYINGYR